MLALSMRRIPFCCLMAVVPGLCWGQEATPAVPPSPSRHQLETLANDLKAERERLEQLNKAVTRLAQDRAALNQSLVSTAQKIKRNEARISAGEERLAGYTKTETRLRESLARRHDVIAHVLGALQRLGRNPPPALLVEPENALQAVRSAILLGAILPEFVEQARFLGGELEELVKVQRLAHEEVAAQKKNIATLEDERATLDALLAARQREQAANEDEALRSRARAASLAGEVKSLQELIDRSEREIDGARAGAERAAAAEAAALVEPQTMQREQKAIDELNRAKDPDRRTLAALVNPGRAKPAISFAKARGLLPLPVSGQKLRSYGDMDSLNQPSKGWVMAPRPAAVVTAPSDGWVAFAGPFRAYGQIVILNAGGGYHILLAGMEATQVNIGQFVVAGEPLGRMGTEKLSTASAIDLESRGPVLYIEFRKNGVTVDPGPWWATPAAARSSADTLWLDKVPG